VTGRERMDLRCQRLAECSLERQILAGVHDIVLLTVEDAALPAPDVAPLAFHDSTYRRLQRRMHRYGGE